MNKDNLFNCPDGLAFDTAGNLWIQTDGNYKNEGDFSGMGNNQMLVANTETGEIKRFLVGPKECEVTGITWSTDKTTLFVGIQHPGERGNSHFPDGGNSVPRSSVIAIERDDGQAFG
jgi:secreted PhoX family phosphatase